MHTKSQLPVNSLATRRGGNLRQAPRNGWFTIPLRVPRPRLRLVCFPYSGSGASMYFAWGKYFARLGIEVWSVQYPGRENRIRERPIVDFAEMIRQLRDAIEDSRPLGDAPFAFFGHSLGTVLAHALGCELQRLNRQQPVHLFLSGRNAPHTPREPGRVHELDDAELIEEIARMGNLPDAVRQQAELMQLLVPVLRADFTLLHDYHERRLRPEDHPVLECPCSVFAGEDDPWTHSRGLADWRQYTSGKFTLRTYPGNHFFLNESQHSIWQTIRDELQATGAQHVLSDRP